MTLSGYERTRVINKFERHCGAYAASETEPRGAGSFATASSSAFWADASSAPANMRPSQALTVVPSSAATFSIAAATSASREIDRF